MILPVSQEARVGIHRSRPGLSSIRRPPDDGIAVVFGGAQQVELPAMHEERGPEGPVDIRQVRPGLAAVAGSKDFRRRRCVFAGLRSKQIVRSDVLARGSTAMLGEPM